MSQDLKTIELAQFVANNTQSSTERKSVEFNTKAIFTLSMITVELLGESVEVFVKNLMNEKETLPTYNQTKTIPVDQFLLTIKLQTALASAKSTTDKSETADIEFSRPEIIIIKKYVMDALAEQEQKRDEDNKVAEHIGDFVNDPAYKPSFDADKYIILRHLSLDMREWLCGTIIE